MPNNDATESPKSLTKATVQNVLAHQQPTSATALQSQADTLSGTTTTLVTNTALLPSARVDSAELQLINTVNPSPQQPATEGASLQQTSSPQNQLSDQFEPKYAFVKQIINALHDGKSELRLSLYPAQLGQVVIAMSLEGQHLSIDLKTSSQDAQDALTLGEDSLKEALTREGFILDSFAISNRPDENKRRPPHRQAPSQQTARSSSPDVQFSIDMIA
jgi:flagellar hook-length control protein FliK